MKKYILFISLFLLNGCYYSFEGECIVPIMQVVPSRCYSGLENYPRISRYQKPYSLGKTDSKQRWKDVVACGGIYGDYDNAHTDVKIPILKRDLFHECMSRKGYIHLNPAECGFQNHKSDTGKCNL